MNKAPTIKQLLTEAKAHGYEVTKARAKLNGQQAYQVKGHNGLFTKNGLMGLLGY